MMKRNVLPLLVLLLTACGGEAAPGSEEGQASQVTEGLSPVSLIMYVQPGTLPPVPPKTLLVDDPNRATPLLTRITVFDNATSDSGTYSTSAAQAIANITAAEWATMSALINDHTHQTIVAITYDNSVSGANKPLIGGPQFSAVPLQ
jgi:hypothetical protein